MIIISTFIKNGICVTNELYIITKNKFQQKILLYICVRQILRDERTSYGRDVHQGRTLNSIWQHTKYINNKGNL